MPSWLNFSAAVYWHLLLIQPMLNAQVGLPQKESWTMRLDKVFREARAGSSSQVRFLISRMQQVGNAALKHQRKLHLREPV
jgi:hypothetical protein